MSNKKIADSGFHHIALRAHDFDKSVNFYENTLGFAKKLSWERATRERRCSISGTAAA